MKIDEKSRDSHIGRYGRFGGRYVAEALWHPLQQVADAFDEATADQTYLDAFEDWLDNRVGRPTPVTELTALSRSVGGARLWLKREDLCDGGAFTSNLAVAYGLLARRMGRNQLVGETATGDFGVALASTGAAMGLETKLFVGRADVEAEEANMRRIEELGATIETVDSTNRGRKAAGSEALQYWAAHSDEAFYCPSSLAAPDPYPRMIEYFLSVIGAEMSVQLERRGFTPEYLISPIGSGSFGVGFFAEFVDDSDIQLVGVEGGGDDQSDKHAASLVSGRPGVFHGTHSFLLQDDAGQVLAPFSIAAGLCLSNVGPQHASWAEQGRVHYVSMTDEEALAGVRRLAESEGLLVSLEAGHAIAYALKLLPTLPEDAHVVVGVSGGVRDLERLWAAEQDEGDSQ